MPASPLISTASASSSVRLWLMAALAAVTLAGLQGCGFRLQGRLPLPASLASVELDAQDAQSEFVHELRAALRSSGARLRAAPSGTGAAPAAGHAVLRVLQEKVEERVLSVSARNIPTDYELIYEVEIEVRAAGAELMPAEVLSLSRVYSFDERRLLAKEREKEILVQALARDLASVVMRRLSSL